MAWLTLLSKLAVLTSVVSSMLAMGAGLTVAQIAARAADAGSVVQTLSEGVKCEKYRRVESIASFTVIVGTSSSRRLSAW